MQDEESYEVIPNSAFTVSRTAHRNNTSNYYIGSRKSNFSEVTELLKGKGIDLDNNRFLILQVGSFIHLSGSPGSSLYSPVKMTGLYSSKSGLESSSDRANDMQLEQREQVCQHLVSIEIGSEVVAAKLRLRDLAVMLSH